MKKRLYIFSDTVMKRKDNTILLETVANREEEEMPEEILQNREEFLLGEDIITSSGEKKYLPVEGIDSIFSAGIIRFNSKFLYFLSLHKIPLHVLNYNGKYAGSFIPAGGTSSAVTLLKQAAVFNDPDDRLYLAQQFVYGAAVNQIINLRYYNNRGVVLSGYIEQIEQFTGLIKDTTSVEELMGFEGAIKRAYYSAWQNIFIYPTGFTHRVKRPPDNMINSLISYGNMIVYGVCLNEIYQTRIYPEISFLHEPTEGRLSLHLDLAELFKPLLTDRIIFKVINKNIIGEKDFIYRNGYCYIKKNARRLFAQEFEKKLTTKILIREKDKSISYRGMIRQECYKLAKHINKEENYESFKAKW
jgi:CRISPR-associated protein Cas1